MFGAVEQDIQLQPAQIWVHLTYQTAFIDNAGKLQIRRDVYNLDSRTLAAIKSERGIVEAAPERNRERAVASGSGLKHAPRPAGTDASFQPVFYEASHTRPTLGLLDRRLNQ